VTVVAGCGQAGRFERQLELSTCPQPLAVARFAVGAPNLIGL
jgi:hypothetical protein